MNHGVTAIRGKKSFEMSEELAYLDGQIGEV
jgi:hypothetical protein